MKQKRLLSIILALLMVVSTLAFSGCSSSEEETSTANTSTRGIVTLNMYIITNDSTTTDSANKVQKAINEVLLPNYKTVLKINCLKESEYWDAVDNMLEETKEPSMTSATVKGTEKMDFPQMIEYIYKDSTTDIELTQPQIDIFVINDYEKYTEYAKDGKLKGLNEYISYDSKKLSSHIYPTIMTAAKIGNETYGIPTNVGMEHGDYTYLVFNEDLLKKYGFEVKQVTEFATNNFAKYLAAVKEGESDIWPLSEPFGVAGLEFYNDEPAFMSRANQFNYMASGSTPALMEQVYKNNLIKRVEYKELGYYPAEGEAAEDAKYAIRVETSPELLDGEGEKRWVDEDGTTYIRYLFDIPRVSVEDAFTSVMCVSATSPVPERAMEIITLFQTNSELANLLQYGVENVNYQIDERDGSLVMLDDTYSMNNLITGNTYIKYPENNDKDYVENCKKMNLAAAPSWFIGVDYDFESASDKQQYECARVILLGAQEKIDNGADVNEVIAEVTAELVNLGCVRESAVSDYGGIFGTIQVTQRNQANVVNQNFAISDEIIRYNEDYGIIIKGDRNKTEEVAEGEEGETDAADAEVSDDAAGEEVSDDAAGEDEVETEDSAAE